MKTVEQQIKKMPRRMKSWALMITYEGVFETRKEWPVSKLAVGEAPHFGFGHEGYYPAQLVVVDMTDPIWVKKTPGRQ